LGEKITSGLCGDYFKSQLCVAFLISVSRISVDDQVFSFDIPKLLEFTQEFAKKKLSSPIFISATFVDGLTTAIRFFATDCAPRRSVGWARENGSSKQEIASPHSVLLGAVFGPAHMITVGTRRQWASKDNDVCFGSKSEKAPCEHMFSALPPKADVAQRGRHVRFRANKSLMHRSKRQLYSITSSGALQQRCRQLRRQSAFAVFKLITSSNLVGCSTGRSAGFRTLENLVDKAG